MILLLLLLLNSVLSRSMKIYLPSPLQILLFRLSLLSLDPLGLLPFSFESSADLPLRFLLNLTNNGRKKLTLLLLSALLTSTSDSYHFHVLLVLTPLLLPNPSYLFRSSCRNLPGPLVLHTIHTLLLWLRNLLLPKLVERTEDTKSSSSKPSNRSLSTLTVPISYSLLCM